MTEQTSKPRPAAVYRVEVYVEHGSALSVPVAAQDLASIAAEVAKLVCCGRAEDGRDAQLTSVVPWKERAIGAEEVGELMGMSPRTVLEKLACRPDFPRRLTARPASWIAGEVLEWRQRHRD